jgi:hypothetical protein
MEWIALFRRTRNRILAALSRPCLTCSILSIVPTLSTFFSGFLRSYPTCKLPKIQSTGLRRRLIRHHRRVSGNWSNRFDDPRKKLLVNWISLLVFLKALPIVVRSQSASYSESSPSHLQSEMKFVEWSLPRALIVPKRR